MVKINTKTMGATGEEEREGGKGWEAVGGGFSLFGFEPRAAFTAAHDALHECEEAVRIFCWGHRTDFML